MNWGELLRNRWVWVGAAGAAGLGAITLLRRRSAGGGSAGAGASESPAYSGGVGGFDSTGTDVAHWLGDYSANLDSQFNEFRTSVEDRLGGLAVGDYETINVSTAHADDILAQVKSYLPFFTLQDLVNINPGIPLAQANANGYISASNPAGNSPTIWVISSPWEVKIPAKPKSSTG